MAADLMQGQLRHVERELLDEIRRKLAVGIEAYAVPGWRGRWHLVSDAGSSGYVAGRVFNRRTFRDLEGRGEIMIGDMVDLDPVHGMTVANGAPWGPHQEQGYRLTLPDQSGDHE